MFGERLANPGVLPIVGTDNDDQIVPCRIVRMEEVGDEADEGEASRQYDELIFFSELLK